MNEDNQSNLLEDEYTPGNERVEPTAHQNGATGQLTSMEKDVVAELHQTIKKEGKYSDLLDTQATAYAAGSGLSFDEARDNIIQLYTQDRGESPIQYSDRRYEERRHYREQNGNGNKQYNQQNKGRSR